VFQNQGGGDGVGVAGNCACMIMLGNRRSIDVVGDNDCVVEATYMNGNREKKRKGRCNTPCYENSN
jgi:hypothetical protein